MPPIVTSALSALASIPTAFAAWMGWTKQKDAQMNTPAMQTNAQAAQDEADSEQLTLDINAAHAGKPEALEKDEA